MTDADRDAIAQLKARYCRFIDTKRWAELRALFTPDCRFEGLGSAPSGATVDIFVTGISTRFCDATSIHHCHMPEIKVTGPDTARAVWAMMDYVQWPEGFAVAEVPGHPGFQGYGHYEEEYRRQDGAWRISFLRLTRLRFDALPAGHAAPRPGRLQASTNWIDGET
jgi:hypothetical protein